MRRKPKHHHRNRPAAVSHRTVPVTAHGEAQWGLPVSWPLGELFKPPAVFPAPEFSAPGVQALFYASVPYRGKPTRVFAWMGVPELPPGQTCPGMVLLHGGGATAVDEWVRLWNARGYAAIAMDTCGCVPGAPETRRFAEHARHEHGGPAGWHEAFVQAHDPVEDQWLYHAVAAAIAGHSLLAAQPGVDPGRIGATGISWGGVEVCLLAGVDSRLKAVVPVYGCGFLGYDSCWKDNDFPKLRDGQGTRWLGLWDPSHYLPRAAMPMCWVTGTNDFAFPLSALRLSCRVAAGSQDLCVRVDMPHGHNQGEDPEEIRVFADAVLRGGAPLPRFRETGGNGDKVWAVCEGARPIVRAELCATRALGHWTDRRWNVYPTRFDAATGRIEAELPPRATAWFFNVVDDRNCVVSTPYSECMRHGIPQTNASGSDRKP